MFDALAVPSDESQRFDADRNMALEMRAGEGHSERLPQLAKDLVASNVDVILTFSFPAATAAKNATTTIPIVATEMGGDPGAILARQDD